jgi:hypothetical protein
MTIHRIVRLLRIKTELKAWKRYQIVLQCLGVHYRLAMPCDTLQPYGALQCLLTPYGWDSQTIKIRNDSTSWRVIGCTYYQIDYIILIHEFHQSYTLCIRKLYFDKGIRNSGQVDSKCGNWNITNSSLHSSGAHTLILSTRIVDGLGCVDVQNAFGSGHYCCVAYPTALGTGLSGWLHLDRGPAPSAASCRLSSQSFILAAALPFAIVFISVYFLVSKAL